MWNPPADRCANSSRPATFRSPKQHSHHNSLPIDLSKLFLIFAISIILSLTRKRFFFSPRQSLETVDNGKPFTQATGDVQAAIGLLRYYAGWADKIEGRTIPTEGQVFGYTRAEPVGVVGIVSIECIIYIVY